MIIKIFQVLNHERYQIITAIICIFLLVAGLCCESHVLSLQHPTKKVNREQLTAEVEYFMAIAETRFAALGRQDQWKALAFDQIALWSTAGTFNPAGLIPLIAGILGVGALTDNVRKRITIKKLNNAG